MRAPGGSVGSRAPVERPGGLEERPPPAGRARITGHVAQERETPLDITGHVAQERETPLDITGHVAQERETPLDITGHVAQERETPLDGPGAAEAWTPIEYNHRPRRGRASGERAPGADGHLRARRAAATRARHRRLLAIDLACGVVVALLGLALAPGLAIVAVLATLGLLALAVSLLLPRSVRRRRTRVRSKTRQGPLV